MRCRTILIALLVLLAAAAVFLVLGHLKLGVRSEPVSQRVTAAPSPHPVMPSPVGTPHAGPSPDSSIYETEAKWIWWNEQKARDPKFEWKMPIRFFGKVVDEKNQPIEGATASCIWTDMSPEGTSTAKAVSDRSGSFTLAGVQGKRLQVRVSKEGFYPSARDAFSFEYAAFFEENYHEPDPNSPVIFHLRKKGEPAPLIASHGKVVVALGAPTPLPMPQVFGSFSPVNVTVFESDGKARAWRAHVAVDGGGIVPALEEFPFEAPSQGYKESIALDEDSPQPPGWQSIDEGGRFYIKTQAGYGLLELRQMKGKKTLHFKILLNPGGGKRLEPAEM